MELNNIQLPSFLVAELYKNSLVETSEKISQNESLSDNINWKYLGNNEKNIMIIVDYNDSVHLPDEKFDFLSNMLSACKLSIGDVAIMNVQNHSGLSYKDLITNFKSKVVLLLGVEPAMIGLPLNFPQFQVQSFSGQTYLFTPHLDDVEKDKVIKSKLWVCLRRIFGV
jgi:hypothetical protein